MNFTRSLIANIPVKKAATDEGGESKKGEDPCKEIDANRTQVSFFFAGDLINLIL